jgi:triosephosphate isomerase
MIIGNWKMHGDRQFTSALCAAIAADPVVERVPMVVVPPFPYLTEAVHALRDSEVACGAQDCAAEKQGAYTGQVSAAMLRDVGCGYVLLGHSERRTLCHESNELLGQKYQQAIAAGLVPVFCVGETLSERQDGRTLEVIEHQLSAIIESVPQQPHCCIAYEPVWAIGTGVAASPAEAQAVHAAVRAWLSGVDAEIARHSKILYGGSVKPSNAQALFAQPDIDGALVGGASLLAKDFLSIGDLCSK